MTFTTRIQPSGLGSPEPSRFPGALATGLMILLFFVALGVMFAREEQRRLDDPVLQAQRGEVTVASAGSLLQEANVAKALALLEGAAPAGSKVQSLRLTPTDIQGTLAHPNGRQVNVRIDAGLNLTSQRSGGVRPTGPAASEIDPAIPAKLIARAERKLKLKPADLDYVLLTVFSDEPMWGLYYSEPPLDNDATAAFDGSDLRLLGTPSAADRKAEREREAAQERLKNEMEQRLREAGIR